MRLIGIAEVIYSNRTRRTGDDACTGQVGNVSVFIINYLLWKFTDVKVSRGTKINLSIAPGRSYFLLRKGFIGHTASIIISIVKPAGCIIALAFPLYPR